MTERLNRLNSIDPDDHIVNSIFPDSDSQHSCKYYSLDNDSQNSCKYYFLENGGFTGAEPP